MSMSFQSRLGAATMALALLAAPARAQVPTFTVSNAQELGMMLSVIRTQAVVLLNPGTYADVSLQNIRPTGDITIRSANPANRATLGRVLVRASERIRFDQVNFHGPRRPGEGETISSVMVREADMIHFTNCRFTGTPNNDPNDDGILLRYLKATNIIVLNSVFREARVALSATDSTNVQFVGNNIRVVREGINLAGVHSATLDRNFFADIWPFVEDGDHADAIQVFTGTATRNTKSVQITNNAIILNSDTSQGIFIRNETGNPTFNPAGFNITNNIYYGVVRHAITINNMKTATISRNTVVAAPGMIVVPSINAFVSEAVSVTRNIMPLYLGVTPGAYAANVLLANPKGPGVDTAAQFTGAVNIVDPPLTNFRVRAGSAAALAGAGATYVSDIGNMTAAGAELRYANLRTRMASGTPIDPDADENGGD